MNKFIVTEKTAVWLLSLGLLSSAALKIAAAIKAAGRIEFAVLGHPVSIEAIIASAVIEVLAVALLFLWPTRYSGLVSISLFVVYAVVSVGTWVMGEDLAKCGCFGQVQVPVFAHLLVVAGGMLLSLQICKRDAMF